MFIIIDSVKKNKKKKLNPRCVLPVGVPMWFSQGIYILLVCLALVSCKIY